MFLQSANLDWLDLAVRGATVLLTSVGVAYTLWNWRAARFRTKLKDDLEILRGYREELIEKTVPGEDFDGDVHYKALRRKIHRKMYRAYIKPRTNKSDFVVAAFFLLGAGVAYYLGDQWYGFWLGLGLAAPLIAMAGIFFLAAFEKVLEEPEDENLQTRN